MNTGGNISSTNTSDQDTQEPVRALRPSVDIFEDDKGITVQADMPGVSREHLNVHIDGDDLLISGDLDISMPEGMTPIHADIRYTGYRRNFTLSRELDANDIDAKLNDGVLTLRIPKRQQYQPRKIEVQAS